MLAAGFHISLRTPHYERCPGTDGREYTGYANSHQVLGDCFYDDILAAKEQVEHGILEFFYDAYIYARDKSGYFFKTSSPFFPRMFSGKAKADKLNTSLQIIYHNFLIL